MSTLAERWKEVVADWKAKHHPDHRGEGFNKFDEAIGASGGTTSLIAAGKKLDPALHLIREAARVAEVRPAWLAFEIGPKAAGDEAERLAEMPAITFISKLLPLQKLVTEIQNHPEKGWKLWHLAGVVDGNLSDASGNPVRATWADLLDEQAGQHPAAKVVGDKERVRAIARQQSPGSDQVVGRTRRPATPTMVTPISPPKRKAARPKRAG